MFLVPFLLAFILAGFLSHAPSTEGATSPEADPLKTGRSFVKVEPERIEEYRLKVKEMFYHGFYSYMSVAFPLDEMKPLSGAGFDTLGNFSLTLVDALDTLMVLGDKTSFIYGLRLLGTIDFRLDVNVSVFETNIRILGGLLSCHIMAATDPYVSKFYDWSLLEKAEDLGNRLLVAFDTPTGLPYGTVNLLTGVNKDESEDVCTACAGSFSIEFTWLSLLTDNPKYEMAARRAMRALWKRRSTLDLFENHINVRTGEWTYKECTIGGLVDSYYEYLLKSYVGFSDEEEYNEMFWRSYRAVKIYMKQNDWHVDVDMNTGTMYAPLFHSLGAFWPGVKIMAGDVSEAMAELNSISYLFNHVKFLPEALNLQNSNLVEGRIGYPLRPEFVESLWLAFRATKDSNILQLGMEIVDRLNNMTRTKYGFANVKDVRTAELEDKMESFFLAETLKYLYLLFDASNPFNSKNYIFNTEAHPFPVWKSHYTSKHPLTDDEKLDVFNSKIPPIPVKKAGSRSYYGDDRDRVTTGFAFKRCWAEDWRHALTMAIEQWRG